jgi:hypothetical protein
LIALASPRRDRSQILSDQGGGVRLHKRCPPVTSSTIDLEPQSHEG